MTRLPDEHFNTPCPALRTKSNEGHQSKHQEHQERRSSVTGTKEPVQRKRLSRVDGQGISRGHQDEPVGSEIDDALPLLPKGGT